MRFLPIVERELRVAARRPRTYWVRLLIAFVGIAIGAVMLGAYSVATQPQAAIGKALFQALSGLAFVYCLFAGRLATADSISEEKREGTLGLLFLTDLKGYDIVVGKIVATSLNSFYGLLAILPVLSLPLLLGGMTNGEFARMVLVLVSTFLLSLAIGICASALHRDARHAFGQNLLVSLAIMALLPMVGATLISGNFGYDQEPEHLLASPLFAFFYAADKRYALNPELFWWSIGIAQGWTWLQLFVASWAVPRNWQDQPSLPRGAQRTWREFWRVMSYGRAAKQKSFRKQLLDINGYYWLTARARLKPLHVWLLIVGAAGWWLGGWYSNEGTVWLDPATGIALAVILNTALKMWVAIEAGQQISEDRRAGAMELLLSTPLTVKDILTGQFLALRRQFLGPLLAILAIEVSLMAVSLRSDFEAQTLYLWLVGIGMLLADIVALTLTSMAAALTAKNQQQAIGKTFFRILVLPWIAFWIIGVLASLWAALGSDGGEPLSWRFNLGLWFGLGMLADLVFGTLAARCLLTKFRQLATERFDGRVARTKWRWFSHKALAASDIASVAHASAEQPLTPPASPKRRRRFALALATAIALFAVGSVYVYRQLYPTLPGPVVIQLAANESLANLHVFSGSGGFYFVMPDDSLWHWGQGTRWNGSGPIIPRLLDATNRWRSVGAADNGVYGLRTDGTIWLSMFGRDGSLIDARQIGSDRDWVSLAVGQGHNAAIKPDGTLWMWGDNRVRQLGVDTPVLQAEPIQVGTNRNWQTVRPRGQGTLGLQTDGSLWFWGEVSYLFKNNTRTNQLFPQPTLYCRETNWTTLAERQATYARDSAGTWRTLLYDLPDPNASVDANTKLFLNQAKTDRLVFGLAVEPVLYPAVFEARPDGSLMFSPYTFPNASAGSAENWQRFDARSDWLQVWSNSGTMLGLTADGTLWTWGFDLTAEADSGLKARHARLEEKLNQLFNWTPRWGPNTGQPPLQIKPRPVIKFVREK